MSYKVVVGGSKRAKAELETGRCYTSKSGAKAAQQRMKKKADKLGLYPGTFWIINCK